MTKWRNDNRLRWGLGSWLVHFSLFDNILRSLSCTLVRKETNRRRREGEECLLSCCTATKMKDGIRYPLHYSLGFIPSLPTDFFAPPVWNCFLFFGDIDVFAEFEIRWKWHDHWSMSAIPFHFHVDCAYMTYRDPQREGLVKQHTSEIKHISAKYSSQMIPFISNAFAFIPCIQTNNWCSVLGVR